MKKNNKLKVGGKELRYSELNTTMKAPEDPTRYSILETSDPKAGLIGAPVDNEMKRRSPNSAQVGFGPSGF